MAAPRKLLVGSRLFTELGVPSTPQQRPQRTLSITKCEWTRFRRLVTPSGHDHSMPLLNAMKTAFTRSWV